MPYKIDHVSWVIWSVPESIRDLHQIPQCILIHVLYWICPWELSPFPQYIDYDNHIDLFQLGVYSYQNGTSCKPITNHVFSLNVINYSSTEAPDIWFENSWKGKNTSFCFVTLRVAFTNRYEKWWNENVCASAFRSMSKLSDPYSS